MLFWQTGFRWTWFQGFISAAAAAPSCDRGKGGLGVCCAASSMFSVRFGSVWFGLIRFGSIRFDSIRFDSIRFGSIRFGSIRFLSGFVWVTLLRLFVFFSRMAGVQGAGGVAGAGGGSKALGGGLVSGVMAAVLRAMGVLSVVRRRFLT